MQPPKKKGGDLKSTSPSKEAILVWDQLQRVGKRNLGMATFLSWQVDLLQRLPPSFRKLHVYLCKLHKNVGSLCCSPGKSSVWVWGGFKQAYPHAVCGLRVGEQRNGCPVERLKREMDQKVK